MRNHNVLNLGAGEGRALYGCAGHNFIFVKAAPFDMLLTIDNGEALNLPLGTEIKLNEPIKQEIRIENLGANAGDFKLVTGKGEYSEPQLVGEMALKAAEGYAGLPAVTFDVQNKTVLAGARKELTITAADTNQGKIWVGGTAAEIGTPLGAGQFASVPAKGSVNFYADNVNDKMYLAEVV